MKRNARVDDNQKQIVEVFRKSGFTVLHLHAVGQGCPDLLVAKHGKNVLVEVKDGKKPPSKQKLTPAQQSFHQAWRGQIMIVRSISDVNGIDAMLCLSQ